MGSRDSAPKHGGGVKGVLMAVAVAFARIFGTAYDPEGARRARDAASGAATRLADSGEPDRTPPTVSE
jgi:hypothetical protein